MTRFPRWALTLLATGALTGCSDGGKSTVRCVTDDDCPGDQQCVGGNCQLPGDPGIRTCDRIEDCKPGEFCDNGVCRPLPDEPDAGVEDGDAGPGDPGSGDPGPGDPGGDPGADRPQVDYSHLSFTVAVARAASSGPATQCVSGVRPQENAGGSLPLVTVADGFTLSGSVESGAEVRILAERPACVPGPVTAAGGQYAFFLAGGSYDVQAIGSGGKVAHQSVAVSSNTTRNLSFPAGVELAGGPVTDDNSQGVNGWTVQGWYRTGTNAGKLSHAGVQTTTIDSEPGMFAIPLPGDAHHDLLGFGPQGGPYPPQVLYEDVDPNGPDLFGERLKVPYTLSGRVTFNDLGAPGTLFRLERHNDPRLEAEASAGTDGNYQVQVRAGAWDLEVVPSAAAFNQGAAAYLHPDYSLYTDKSLDIALAQAEQVTFTGRIEDIRGQPVTDATVRLLLDQAVMTEGDYSTCDTQPASTDATGTFNIRCNILPP